MITETFYKVNQDGRLQRIKVQADDLNLQTDLLARFAVENGIKITNLIDAGILGAGATGMIGLSSKTTSQTFTIPVAILPMRAAFAMGADGVLKPDFAASTTTTNLMDLKWEVPDGMKVYLMVVCLLGSTPYSETQFLVALDKAGRTFRLPTSNCYEDCKLCAGSYNNEGQTYMDVLCKAWAQFTSSNWNSDLNNRGTNTKENSQRMFRYKPKEKEGFEQLPIEGRDWTVLSTKISNEFINSNIVI